MGVHQYGPPNQNRPHTAHPTHNANTIPHHPHRPHRPHRSGPPTSRPIPKACHERCAILTNNRTPLGLAAPLMLQRDPGHRAPHHPRGRAPAVGAPRQEDPRCDDRVPHFLQEQQASDPRQRRARRDARNQGDPRLPRQGHMERQHSRAGRGRHEPPGDAQLRRHRSLGPRHRRVARRGHVRRRHVRP